MNTKANSISYSSLIGKLLIEWDLRLGPYRAFFLRTEKYLDKCKSIIGETEEPVALIAACQDTLTGDIVACLHLKDTVDIRGRMEKAVAFNIAAIGEERVAKMVTLSKLHFATTKNKTMVSQVLLSHCFLEILKVGGMAVLSECDVGHFSLYKRMGMRPIGRLYKTSSGSHSIPMIFHPDENYFVLINSPILSILRGINFNTYRSFCDWYYDFLRANIELQTGAAYYPEREDEFEGHHIITDGLTEEGIDTLLKNAMVIKCRENEVLMAENDGGNTFGFIQKGVVEIVIKGKKIVTLSAGDIFGEIAFILDTPRSAKVIAVSPETEVVLLNAQAIDNLKNEKDKTTVWQNLSKVLAQRVLLTNKLLK